MKTLLLLTLLLAQFACTAPATVVRTGAARPTVSIKGAPADAELLVDGLSVGVASRYDGNPNLLTVEEGMHVLSVVRQGKVVHTEKAFVSSGESRAITLNLGN
ncbi:MAG: hypothetical protein H7327_02455 [Herminiimonas sp.]|nr:hypothetical protein [Herminiimonas sp.]